MQVIGQNNNCVVRPELSYGIYCACNPDDVSSFPDLTFLFGNVTLLLEPEYYLINEGPNGCLVPF
jgi:hypothetical protein